MSDAVASSVGIIAVGHGYAVGERVRRPPGGCIVGDRRLRARPVGDGIDAPRHVVGIRDRLACRVGEGERLSTAIDGYRNAVDIGRQADQVPLHGDAVGGGNMTQCAEGLVDHGPIRIRGLRQSGGGVIGVAGGSQREIDAGPARSLVGVAGRVAKWIGDGRDTSVGIVRHSPNVAVRTGERDRPPSGVALETGSRSAG